MESTRIYEDIALRTAGDIYLGVVGPVRTGKSTFIKRFMETLVLPNIENVYARERARDELPQSGSGRTVMTAEPKFVPEEAAVIPINEATTVSVRLIDCVGFMVPGAIGLTEEGFPRMVTTPWFDHEIPMTEAAEIGTRKVIAEHSTIGIVITTDGTITDIERENYIEAEDRVIKELMAIGKPFVVLVNSAAPYSEMAQRVREEISQRYGVTCLSVNCLELNERDITEIIKAVLFEFPISEVGIYLPAWVDALPTEHPIKSGVYNAIRESSNNLYRIRDASAAVQCRGRKRWKVRSKEINLGNGVIIAKIELPRELFYKTLSEQSGFDVDDDGDLMSLMTEMSVIKSEYDRIKDALSDVKTKGYGIVMPSMDEMELEEPEIVKHGGRYSVRLKASAPSIHMIKAWIETEVSPAVGGERSSEDMINYLLQAFEGDIQRIWSSNLSAKSLNEIAARA